MRHGQTANPRRTDRKRGQSKFRTGWLVAGKRLVLNLIWPHLLCAVSACNAEIVSYYIFSSKLLNIRVGKELYFLPKMRCAR